MKYTAKFLLESKNNREGEMRIRFRVRWNKTTAQFLVQYTVNAEKWSAETNRCKPSTTHGKHKIQANVINKELQRYEDITEHIFNDAYRNNKVLTQSEFKIAFDDATGKNPAPKQERSFFDAYDEFTTSQGLSNSWTKATFTKFASIKLHLLTFDKDLSFEQLNEAKLQQFVSYQQTKEAMQLTFEKAEIGLRNTTIQKNIAFIKWFLRWSSNKEYYSGNLHNTFRPKLKGTDGNSKVVIYLTWDELLKLFNFNFKQESIQHVRDVFCFCCFTSLRYSDVAKLRRSDVKDKFIRVVTQKTADGLKIELNKYSLAILDKYKEIHFDNDLALPIISNAKMNVHLKTMAKLAGINDQVRVVYFIGSTRYEEVYPKHELITTHCGRRTFIVNALYLGIPAEVVMSWTGHSDYESMKPYIAIVDELKQTSMDKFNK
jgi:integrase